MNIRTILAVALIGFVQFGCGSKVECGSGTKESNGRCVASTSTDTLECGAGTEDEDGVCVVSGEAVVCGVGTMLDANTGECTPTPVETMACGINTAFDAVTGTCLPTDEVCSMGTTFDDNLAVCMPDVACQAGDVVINGICVAPFEELFATATVMSTEPDNAFVGDTPTPITLAADGTELVLGGTIDPPVDADGDGTVENDIDMFEFTAPGPMWLTITVQAEDSTLAGFLVTNEDQSWLRQAPLVGPRGAAREVLIPAGGLYRVGFGTPVTGYGEGNRWVGTIQSDPMPTPRQITFGNDVNGDFAAGETGFLTAAAFSGFGTLSPVNMPVNGVAEVMLYDGTSSWSPIGVLGDGQPDVNVISGAGVQLYVDPIDFGPSLDRMYTVATAQLPAVALGAIAGGQTLTTPSTTFSPTDTLITVDAPAGVVLEFTPNGNIELSLPTNPGPLFGPKLYLPVKDAGTVVVTARSNTNSTSTVSVRAIVPKNLGTIPADGSIQEAVGTLDGSAFFLVSFTDPLVRVRQTNATQAEIEVAFWGDDWLGYSAGLLADSTTTFGQRSYSQAVGSGPYLFEVRSQFGPVSSLSVTLGGTGPVPLGNFALGDTLAVADPTPLAQGDEVLYSFTLTTDALLRGTIDAGGPDVDGDIYDVSSMGVWRGFTSGGEDVNVFLPAGDYTLKVAAYVALPNGFTVDIDFTGLPTTMEAEPNNTVATGMPLTLGTDILGTSGDDDWYTFTVVNSGIFTVTFGSITSGGPIEVELTDGTGAALYQGFNGNIRGFLEAGSYAIQAFGGIVGGQYIVGVNRADSGADTDDAGSNDTSGTAQAISVASGSTVMGMLSSAMDEDWYSFTVATQTSFVFTAVSSTNGSRTSQVEILDSTFAPVAETGGLYVLAAGTYYVKVSGTVFGFPDYLITFIQPPGTTYTSTPALAIPDNMLPATVSDTINVPAACTLTNIAIGIDITHPFTGDLEIHLISPTGTDVFVWDGGFGELNGIFGVDLTASEPLSVLIGEEAMGNWTITLGDGQAPDGGMLNSWSVLVDCQ